MWCSTNSVYSVSFEPFENMLSCCPTYGLYACLFPFRRDLNRFYQSWFHQIPDVRQQFVLTSWQCLQFPLGKYEPHRHKTKKMACAPRETQISLGTRPVWSESSLCAQWVVKDPSFLQADSEESAKTLIRLGGCPGWSESSLGAHAFLLVLSRCGSYQGFSSFWPLAVLLAKCSMRRQSNGISRHIENTHRNTLVLIGLV